MFDKNLQNQPSFMRKPRCHILPVEAT